MKIKKKNFFLGGGGVRSGGVGLGACQGGWERIIVEAFVQSYT